MVSTDLHIASESETHTPLNRRSIVSFGVSMESAALRRWSCILRRAASSARTLPISLVNLELSMVSVIYVVRVEAVV
jgi:hypothetical protein